MALDLNIKNNLFRKVGAIGANLASAAVIQSIKKNLFDGIGENNIISARGFLGSQTARLIREFLFTQQGAYGQFDPVWKLTTFTAGAAGDTQSPAGSIDRTTEDDFAGADHPKNKFSYTISFNYRQTLKDVIAASTDPQSARAMQGSDAMKTMAFGIKNATRPNPVISYQDINFYNYRTKIATKVDYGTLSVVFYDDVNNRAHDIIATYLKTISPIARISNSAYANFMDTLGISPQEGDPDVSSMGALPTGEEEGLINSITLTHHLPLKYDRTSGQDPTFVNSTTRPVVQYIFMNPKIMSINLDDLDMTSNDASTVGITFTYDSVYIKKGSVTEIITLDPNTTVTSSASSTTFLDKFLNGIDNAVNPFLNGAQESIDQLNDSTLVNAVKTNVTDIVN